MATPTSAGIALFVSLFLAAGPPEGEGREEPVTLTGTVVELTSALKAAGVPFDAEPIARQVVVRDGGGAITPLLSDEASRALFLDERLRDRPARLKALRLPGIPYVRVVSFQVEDEGRLRTPEYFCEICTIRVRYPQTCPCCQGPMDLRMRPEAR